MRSFCLTLSYLILAVLRSGWLDKAALRSDSVPGKNTDSAPMAVKGETDPAARAHIVPTSSRKPPVVGATPGWGGAAKRMLVIFICGSC